MTRSTAHLPGLFTGLSGWRDLAISFGTGIAIALGQAPMSAFWVAVPAIGFAIFLGLYAATPRHAARRGMMITTGYAALTFIWIVEPFLVDITTHGWMAPIALFFMATGVGLFGALAFFLARRIAPAGSWALVLALATFWTATEMLRSYALTGFPWGLTSYIWIDTPVYQLAYIIGPHGLTLLTTLLAGGIAHAIHEKRFVPILAGISLGFAIWIIGVQSLNRGMVIDAPTGPIVRLIQPNADQDQKWDPEMMPVFYNRQLSLTAQEAENPLDLIIWPEVAVPFLLSDPSAPLWEISGAADDIPVVIGAQRFEDTSAFNSLAVLGAAGEIQHIYDKHHLVPFGEYLPLGSVLNKIGLRALAAQFGNAYSAGPGSRVLDLGTLGKVMPLICYEAIFPHELRRVPIRPNWMLMITNDAWFGKKSGPFQHLAQARARAIEFGLPMVRAANTGVSAVIDAHGNVIASMPLGVSGFLDAAIPRARAPGLYWRYGDIPIGMLLIVLGSLVILKKNRNPIDPLEMSV